MLTEQEKKWERELTAAWRDTILKYPVILRADNGMVVLFSNKSEGTVVKKGTSGLIFQLGTYRDDWDMSDFKITIKPISIHPNDCGNCIYELDRSEEGVEMCKNCKSFSNWSLK